jgi:hypothetical protein
MWNKAANRKLAGDRCCKSSGIPLDIKEENTMRSRESSPDWREVRAVSSPGGLARQYRVQFQAADSALWRVFGSFRERRQAENALARLREEGYATRLIDCRICPAAG